MTHHIKSVLVLSLVFFLSCGGNKSIELDKQNESVFEQTLEAKDEFAFYKSFPFCDNQIGAYTQAEADAIYQDKSILLDDSSEKETLDWNSFFYENAQECVENELGEKHASSYLLSTKGDFPFEQVVVFNEKYILVAQDGYFFVFKGNASNGVESNLEAVINQLEKSKNLSLPINYSYELVLELEGFKAINEPVEIPELQHLTDFQFAKLPQHGKIKLLLVSGLQDSGQSEMHLIALNNSFELVDEILLYTHRETEDGGIVTRFEISQDHLITIIEEEINDIKTIVLNESLLKISPDGKFIKVK